MRAGRIEPTDGAGLRSRAPEGGSPGGQNRFSARNRIAGVVREVKADGVMALVEIDAGPYLLAAAITSDAVDELGLAPGVAVVATIKATSVMVSREGVLE